MTAEPYENVRRHKLMTQEIRKKIPKLYATEKIPTEEKIAVVKFFSPYNGWQWYGVEFDGTDTFFGLVEGWETEWGYFSLSELAAAAIAGNTVPAVERDLSFEPTPIGEIKKVGA